MPLYNFKKQFAPYIKDGSKPHTIRAIRKHPAKPGDTLFLYTGLRTKYVEKLIEPPTCTAVKTIIMLKSFHVFMLDGILTEMDCNEFHIRWIYNRPQHVSFKELNESEKNILAWHDGFRIKDLPRKELDAVPENGSISCFDIMKGFWMKEHDTWPFFGHIICWHPQPTSLIYL